MEQVLSYIMAYLPAVAATLMSVIIPLVIKRLVAGKLSDIGSANSKLSKALKDREKEMASLTAEVSKEVSELKSVIEAKAKENEELVAQNKLLLEQNEKIEKLLDEVTTVKHQATALLNEKGE